MAAALATACRAPHATAPAVSTEASAALGRAHGLFASEPLNGWSALSDDPFDLRRRARDEAERAAALAPDWVAPQRLLDDIERSNLIGPLTLERRLQALEERPADGAAAYLVARLEGAESGDGFRRAARVQPGLAWAHHGVAFVEAQAGRLELARRAEERALAAARDPWERSYFASILARYLEGAGEAREALRILAESYGADGLGERRRFEVGLEWAAALLREPDRAAREEGRWLAARILSDAALPDDLVSAAAAVLRSVRSEGGAAAAEAALGAAEGRARDLEQARFLYEAGAYELAYHLHERAVAAGARPLDVRSRRQLAFAAGRFAEGTRTWLAEQPARLLDGNGRPRDERLARVVERALATEVEVAPRSAALAALGAALVEAGWFEEAQSVASALADCDPALALELRQGAAAGDDLLSRLGQVVEGMFAGREYGRLGSREPLPIEDLDELLRSFDPHVERHRARLELALDSLGESPRLTFGPFGELAHPGPWFDAADEREGRGVAGEPVPGLAAICRAVGRFGLVGSSPQGTDAVLLPTLFVEQSAGEHLGAPWSGTLAWCEGRDVRSRADRVGAGVAGAALHEGYWLDVDTLRSEHLRWRQLQADWIDRGESREALERALAVTGRKLRAGEQAAEWIAPLGEDDRVRLAVLRDRRARSGAAVAAPGGDLLLLDELVDSTSIHEEGHLCDRARFLPLGRRWFRALSFFLGAGLSPARALERLEYRAQLVALAEVEDPRVTLAATLSTAGRSPRGAHAAAYRALLEDLMVVLAERVEAAGGAYAGVEAGRVLLHQLHALPPATVRELALELARAEGLVEQDS